MITPSPTATPQHTGDDVAVIKAYLPAPISAYSVAIPASLFVDGLIGKWFMPT